MKELCVVGGRQKDPRDIHVKEEWHHYQQGVIGQVNLDSGLVSESLVYVSPPENCPVRDASILFKAGTLRDNRLYVSTPTEALVFRPNDWTLESRVSLPMFNDVHHVLPTSPGRLLVVNTGLDMAVEVDMDGEIKNEWWLADEEPWERFSKDVDYRLVHTLKPHYQHPNFAFSFGGALWCTRAFSGDAVCLTDHRPKMEVIRHPVIHDGIPVGDFVYFTCVDGKIIRVDGLTGKPERVFDLQKMVGTDTPLGWCRGIEILDQDHVAVGFSRLRPTKWGENVRWIKHQFGGDGQRLRPTRISVFNLTKEELVAEYNLEGIGLNAVFSMHRIASEG